MTTTLSSNLFIFTTTPRSRLTYKNKKLTVFAEGSGSFSPFRLRKQDNGAPTSENQIEESNKAQKWFFDLGKISNGTSLIPVVSKPSTALTFGNLRRKDSGTVFVAGATGQAGVRIAQMLLREGFTVRAGVSDLVAAQELARIASRYKIISLEESKRLNAVESTFQDAESIAKAIGNASKVVVTIGPTENGPTSAVTTSDALQVIQASKLAGVSHVAIVYDGTSISSTYNVIDGISSFFNNFFARSQPLTLTEFLMKVVETDVSYTLIKTNLTDDFSPESSYNVVVTAEGRPSTNDYKVSKSQIASLVANVFSNTAVAENKVKRLIEGRKVVEVSTNPSAPLKPVNEFFSAIPEDGRRKAYAEELAKTKAEEEAVAATEKAREAAEAAKKLEEEVKKLSKQEARATSLAEEAQKKAEAAGTSVENLLSKAKDIGSGLSWEKLSSQIATAVQKSDEKPKVQIATVRGEAKARTLPAKKAVVKQAKPKSPIFSIPRKELKQKSEPTETKKEERKIFGGLFKQETIYIDED